MSGEPVVIGEGGWNGQAVEVLKLAPYSEVSLSALSGIGAGPTIDRNLPPVKAGALVVSLGEQMHDPRYDLPDSMIPALGMRAPEPCYE